jgi:hypothetical protein
MGKQFHFALLVLGEAREYQEVRDNAQDLATRDKSMVAAASMYILPCL